MVDQSYVVDISVVSGATSWLNIISSAVQKFLVFVLDSGLSVAYRERYTNSVGSPTMYRALSLRRKTGYGVPHR